MECTDCAYDGACILSPHNCHQNIKASAVMPDCGALTTREKWLMQKAFEAGWTHCFHFDRWLNDSAADGVTVEMVLCKEAP